MTIFPRDYMPGKARSCNAELVRHRRKNIRRLQLQKGMTQEELAFEAEIDLTYVGGIERGRRNPSLMVLTRIPLKADIAQCSRHVSKVPEADIRKGQAYGRAARRQTRSAASLPAKTR
jgi:DNA-binding XRE family transcriptional regulator